MEIQDLMKKTAFSRDDCYWTANLFHNISKKLGIILNKKVVQT